MGNRNMERKIKEKEIYGLGVGALEFNFGYLWSLMKFINMGQNY